MINPPIPGDSLIANFFAPSLVNAPLYHLDQEPDIAVKVDQNECPYDWPATIKAKILQRLDKTSWNRYPDPFARTLTQRIASRVGLPVASVLTSPGSNYLIPLIMDAIVRQMPGNLIIARPSFALFEEHAKLSGYSYIPWQLNKDFQYDVATLPPLPPGSLLIFASPNNPTGSVLATKDLRTILATNPHSLVIADEAYHEFSGNSYVELLRDFPNLLILQTLSKTMATAGVRIGFALGSPTLISLFSKKRLPYLLNHWAIIAAEIMLDDPEMASFVTHHIREIKSERDRIYAETSTPLTAKGMRFLNTQANFLLLICPTQEHCTQVYQSLIKCGVLVRNVSKGGGLTGCLRIGVGSPKENDQIIASLRGLPAVASLI